MGFWDFFLPCNLPSSGNSNFFPWRTAFPKLQGFHITLFTLLGVCSGICSDPSQGNQHLSLKLITQILMGEISVLWSTQIRSVAQLCPTLCNPMNRITLGQVEFKKKKIWSSFLCTINDYLPSSYHSLSIKALTIISWGIWNHFPKTVTFFF